ncbi:AraC family transcriptional regulator [Alienimonas chondri]|uniref:HTH-type transcriptional activator RhaS n=1 Tax=Alienimonas chondri TaxID=2681879 RepID=A0ABX1VA82_9PLAN|nr:AraC family transcriptional regulator [Alienimonas chondri]NNJ25000.1 HTH-type transcriptional activator RhaS [Alienimonas chondri]
MSSERLRRHHAELAFRIRDAMPEDGRTEVGPGVFFNRASAAGEVFHAVAQPCFCVIAQGSKEVRLGDSQFRYDPARYLITTMELPVSGQVVQASAAEPYLSLRLPLESSLVTSVLAESGAPPARGGPIPSGIDVSELDEDLLDAVVRFVRLLDRPREYRALAPLVMREIVFRLSIGAQAERLRHLTTVGGRSPRMVRAIALLNERFAETLRIDDVAGELNMSPSSFHAHFKAATAMSPLQFQKRLRLQEARRLMLDESKDAAEAGSLVGYEDASQFNREYKRQFGLPPKRDVDRLRGEPSAPVAA